LSSNYLQLLFSRSDLYSIFSHRMVTQLPPIEITFCQYCECMFPLNMLHIHQVIRSTGHLQVSSFHLDAKITCDEKLVQLHNLNPASPQSPFPNASRSNLMMCCISPLDILLTDLTFTYLRPISLQQPSNESMEYPYATIPDAVIAPRGRAARMRDTVHCNH
jgi:hypothetical protein